MRSAPLVVFLGPSLPAPEARHIAHCTVLPPARQGDVWRALALRPRAIALVDGLFESTPSVWHHEILDALDAGVAVFGGASMGALRAAELSRHGMVGVGRIFGWYRDGVVRGDDEVALLHAGAELGYRPLTLPLVNLRRAAGLAVEAGSITPREGRALLAAGAAIFYQQRTWKGLLAPGAPGLRPALASKLRAIFPGGPPNLKAEDARATIEAAAAFVAATARSPAGARAPPGRVIATAATFLARPPPQARGGRLFRDRARGAVVRRARSAPGGARCGGAPGWWAPPRAPGRVRTVARDGGHGHRPRGGSAGILRGARRASRQARHLLGGEWARRRGRRAPHRGPGAGTAPARLRGECGSRWSLR